VLPDGTKTYVLQDAGPEFHSYAVRTLYEGISDRLAGDGEGTSEGDADRGKRHGYSSEAADTFRGGGFAGPAGAGSGTSLAAALTASSRLLALPPTSTALTPGDAGRLDQFFAAGLEEGVSLLLPRSRRNLWRFGAEDVADAAPGWE
jgi:hypothetical protein